MAATVAGLTPAKTGPATPFWEAGPSLREDSVREKMAAFVPRGSTAGGGHGTSSSQVLKDGAQMALTSSGKRTVRTSERLKAIVKFPVEDRRRLTKTTGSVYVDKSETLEDMLDAEALEKTRQIRTGGIRRLDDFSSMSSALTDKEIQKQLAEERRQQEAYHTAQLVKQYVEKSKTDRVAQRERTFNHLVHDVETSMGLLDSVDKSLNLMEETKRNKTRRQFEEWNTQVHGKIQENIAAQINAIHPKELHRRKCQDYAKFLDITNKKPSIFRDIIIESEYDPLEPNRRTIKAKTKRLVDPTHIEAQKAEEEGSMLQVDAQNLAAKPKLCKDTLPVELWASGQIEATPYGCFSKMMSGEHKGDGNPTQRSSVKFDHFDFPSGKAALDVEMPRGKRTIPISDLGNTSTRVFNTDMTR